MSIPILVAAALTTPHARPQTDLTERFSDAYQDCILYGELHNAVAMPPGYCAGREYRVQDARLNRTYRAVLARLSTPRKAVLRGDQRRWIHTRHAACAPAQEDDRAECLAVETYRRTQFLLRYR